MKLTKILEKEILRVNTAYWDSYMKGDWKKTASFLDDNITMIGSTENEVYHNKKQVTRFLKDTAPEIAGNVQMRNRHVKIIPVDPHIMVDDHFDLFIKAGKEWSFYSKVRLTSLLVETKKGWKFIQQHGSVPDTRTQEGETIAFDKISKENIELRDAVKRRTIELEHKNRELKTESALDRVRAVALGMHKPGDLLNVCKVLYKELLALGFTGLRNAIIHSFKDEKGYFIDYDYSDFTGGSVTDIFYNANSIIRKFIKQIRRSDNAFVEITLKGNELKVWKEFRKKGGQPDDPRLNKASAIYYHIYSTPSASIGISTFDVISEDKRQLLKRFRNVFDFAYRRYLDVAQAEKQAYEARIEASLERVRAQAMSIRKSEELAGVGEIIFSELKSLGYSELRNTEIVINNDAKEMIRSYYYSDYGVTGFVDVLYKENPTVKKWIINLKKAKNAFAMIEIPPSQMKAWRKYREEVGHKPDPLLNKAKTVFYYSYSMGLGALSISTWKKVSDEQLITLERFKNVFGLAYRRYADVAKAEAQTREKEIELGLERVRARAMAMQSSDELAELVAVVFKELTKLDFALTSCVIWISDTQTFTDTLWVTSAEMNKPAKPVSLKPFHHSFFHSIIHAWKEKDPRWIFTLKGKEKESFEKAFFSDRPDMPLALKKALTIPKEVVFSASFNNFGALEILGTEPLTEEKFEILHRFGKVFDSSYTRFNDLKIAEGQAREAQIELSLERVRARTMAMHHSDELVDTSVILFQELKTLGVSAIRTGVAIIDDSNETMELWSSQLIEKKQNKVLGVVPMGVHPFFTKLLQAWRRKDQHFSFEMKGDEVKEYYRVMSSFLSYPPQKKYNPCEIFNPFFFPEGSLTVVSHQPLSSEEVSIMQRFARVFGLLYRRFLDLQKAESQAREAQIEAALERVRSRSMGMQKSEELKEVIQVVYDQFVHLNIHVEHTGFVMDYKARDDYNIWVADPLGVPSQVIIPYFDSVYYNRFNEAKEKGEDFFATNLSFEEKNRFYKKLFEYVPGLPEEAKKFYFSCPGVAASTVLLDNVCLYIENFSGIPYTDEENNTLMRFGRVFQQTYTRFLDLQKAEAQAREAKIEAALERARTQSMVMQHSNELNDTLQVFHKQLQLLGINSDFSYLWLPDEENDKHVFWAAWEEDLPAGLTSPKLRGDKEAEKNISTILKSKALAYPLDRNEPNTAECLVAWKSGVPVHTYKVPPAGIKSYFEAWQELFSDAEKLKPEFFPDGLDYVEAFMKYGCFGIVIRRSLTEEENQMLRRFSTEFERAYTRFLDLQKAEAQTKESQIQLALERVRARTMAMQKSDELPDAANLLFRQVQSLNMPAWSAGYCIWDEDKKAITLWMSSEGVIQPALRMPLTEDPSLIHFREGWERGESFLVEEVGGEELKRHYAYLRTLAGVKETLDDIEKAGFPVPTFQIFHLAYFSKGFLLFITYEPVQEAHDMFKRFANVFEQTYTRFLDLQKAEAQAKESQIELGLERVRARAMAMQSSGELSDLVDTVFKELTKLDFALNWCIINIIDVPTLSNTVWAANPDIHKAPDSYHMKFEDYPFHDAMMKGYKERKTKYIYVIEGDEKKVYDEYLFKETAFSKVPEEAQAASRAMEKYVCSFTFSNFGGLQTVGNEPLSEINLDILERFGKVFDLTYTRFNDLLKAEAQAREAQIQLALERVRARTMAMQHSDELKEAAALLFQQVKALGVPAYSCGYNIWEKNDKEFTSWMSTQDGSGFEPVLKIPLTEDPNFIRFDKSRKKGEQFFVLEMRGKIMQAHYRYLKNIPQFRKWFEEAEKAGFALPETQIHHLANFSHGNLLFITLEPCPEFHEVFKRFASVFEQTYTRFLDLQKAEAQTREAQIEVSLERVRAKAMAMHKSDDLNMAVAIVFEELDKLNLGTLRCGIGILNKEKRTADVWTTSRSEGGTVQISGDESMDIHPLLQGAFEAWLKQEEYSYVLQGEDFKNYYRALVDTNFHLPDSATPDIEKSDQQHWYFNAPFESGSLFAFREAAFSEEAKTVMKRFAGVFNLTYKRFLDIQKAEAQAREAQIEASLERVRAHAMAMHNSADLSSTVNIFFKELKTLGITPMRCGVGEMHDETHTSDLVFTTADKQGELYELPGKLKHEGHPVVENIYNYWKKQEEYHPLLQGADINAYYKVIKSQMVLPDFPEYSRHYGNYFYFKEGFFFAWGENEFTREGLNICRRFTTVLSLTYKRYKDLKQAETNAREAQIEAGLERVRSRTLAMHKSDELAETAAVVFKQLIGLGIAPNRLYIGIIKDESGEIEAWATDEDGSKVSKQFTLATQNYSVKKIYDGWIDQKKSITIDMHDKELKDYLHYLYDELNVPFRQGLSQKRRVQYIAYFSKGFIGIASPDEQPESTIQLLERFAAVFNLTYARFNDLQIAEGQTHKANIEVAMERVRARALAMQEPEELKDVAEVLRHEMGLLGIEELETCSIYINDEQAEKAECWYALKDLREAEKKLVSDHFALNLVDTWVGREMLKFYRSEEKQVSIVMTGENRKEWIHYCEKMSVPFRGYYGEVIPDRTYHLYKFSHGAIGAASAGDISFESWDLLQRAASVFSLAYSRFKDLTQARLDLERLKEEKRRAENALTELKATQTQLIQSEKMASLGELTAGIAHEIQNPLNFVNNFSDVSNELLDEMKMELAKGNAEDAMAIVEDVKQNLEKILHHGKRADAIVKGMLQHSRSGSGQKELTDINALADEYLRLAYHGLRAKDKSFNARFSTDFDESIGKINILPQDIGRVILNLINNAFYAVSEKKKQNITGYEPTVTVRTAKNNGKVEVDIKDNGNGIPQKVLDKIFQPFFTTKPTGQGTGLGLSLSYDIIKAHGGEIKVNTIENEGTEFVITLPV